MKVFRFSSETIQTIQKRHFKTVIPICGGAVLIAVTVMLLMHHDEWDRISFLIATLFSTSVLVITQFLGARRRREALESYAITWEPLTITRSQKNIPDIVLYHGEIQHIEITKKGALLVRGQQSRDFFSVPREIDGYEELKTLLEEIRPLEAFSAPQWIVLQGGLPLLAFISLAIASLVHGKVPILCAGSIAIGLNIGYIIRVFRSKQVNQAYKAFRIIRIILMACVVIRILAALTGGITY